MMQNQWDKTTSPLPSVGKGSPSTEIAKRLISRKDIAGACAFSQNVAGTARHEWHTSDTAGSPHVHGEAAR